MDDAPAMNLLTSIYNSFNWEIKRKMSVSCVDVNSGDYIIFNEKDGHEIVKGIVSSASIAFVFPAQVWDDRGIVCIDGGTAWATNLVSAVERCRE